MSGTSLRNTHINKMSCTSVEMLKSIKYHVRNTHSNKISYEKNLNSMKFHVGNTQFNEMLMTN